MRKNLVLPLRVKWQECRSRLDSRGATSQPPIQWKGWQEEERWSHCQQSENWLLSGMWLGSWWVSRWQRQEDRLQGHRHHKLAWHQLPREAILLLPPKAWEDDCKELVDERREKMEVAWEKWGSLPMNMWTICCWSDMSESNPCFDIWWEKWQTGIGIPKAIHITSGNKLEKGRRMVMRTNIHKTRIYLHSYR